MYDNRAECVRNGWEFFPYGDVYLGSNLESLVLGDLIIYW